MMKMDKVSLLTVMSEFYTVIFSGNQSQALWVLQPCTTTERPLSPFLSPSVLFTPLKAQQVSAVDRAPDHRGP